MRQVNPNKKFLIDTKRNQVTDDDILKGVLVYLGSVALLVAGATLIYLRYVKGVL